jgi:acetyl esterase/lipase
LSLLTRRRFGLLATAAGLAGVESACSPLSTLESLIPKDAGSRRVAHGVAFGPGPRRTLDIYAPAHASDRPWPVLVFIYGGSWASGRKADYGFAGRALAAQGFVVVIPDYRLVPEVRFPGFVQDGAAAIGWTAANIARYGGDARRIAVAGHSAGAYIALMLALDRRWIAEAGLDPRIIRAAVGLSGPYDFYPFDVSASINAFGQAPDAAATQPVNFARSDAPPVFLGTGDRDTTVRPRNTFALADALRRKGAGVEVKIYPGLDHASTVLALSLPFRGRAPVLHDTAAFLRAHDTPA